MSTETQKLEIYWLEENAGIHKQCLSRLSESQDGQDFLSNAMSPNFGIENNDFQMNSP